MKFDEIIKLWKGWRKRNLKEMLEAKDFKTFNFITDQVYVVDNQNQESWKQEDFDQVISLIKYRREKLEKTALKYKHGCGGLPVFYEDSLSRFKYVLDKLGEKARGKARVFIENQKDISKQKPDLKGIIYWDKLNDNFNGGIK